tara:strand:+ start:48018 stop:48182 length:165 start_codon:yes stop_codon:yes gene_type:complete
LFEQEIIDMIKEHIGSFVWLLSSNQGVDVSKPRERVSHLLCVLRILDESTFNVT